MEKLETIERKLVVLLVALSITMSVGWLADQLSDDEIVVGQSTIEIVQPVEANQN